jgi:23S rRNA (guanosine2251-2'-O)-methyltransferase
MRKLNMAELNRVSVDEFKVKEKLPVVVILDNIRSQNNIGSVFRTADAFLMQEIHLCGITATPPHREIHKTALGATESVDWKYFPSTLDSVLELKSRGYIIYGVEQTTRSIQLNQFNPDMGAPFALVFGNEVFGIDENVLPHLDFSLEIPQAGTKHSLNVSVAAGIVLYDIFNKMEAATITPGNK